MDFVLQQCWNRGTLPTEKLPLNWKTVIDINLMGIIYGTYTAIPIMREQGFGHIVNTASITGRVPVPYQAVYAASKSAVISMTESLQYELETEGVQFSVFCPGNVKTGIFGNTPPPDAITVKEAVDYIFQELEKKSLIIIFLRLCVMLIFYIGKNRAEFNHLPELLQRRENFVP